MKIKPDLASIAAMLARYRRVRSVGGLAMDLPPYRTLTAKTKALVRKRDRVCVYCGGSDVLVFDHFVPKSRGGGHGPDNVVLACHACNAHKAARPVEEWLRHG